VFDIIYLSPHLDDAVLSGGGHLAQSVRKGLRVKVVTVFAGDQPAGFDSPAMRDLRGRTGLGAESGATRRAEDVASCRCLGAAFEHWEFLDATFRTDGRGRARYPTLDSLFAQPVGDDALEAVTRRMTETVKAGLVVAPLGVGGHVDHRLVRLAAEQAFGPALACYEDFPYAQRFGALWRTLSNPFAWRGERVMLEEADLAAKIDAVRAHASQAVSLFHNDADLVRMIRRYARRRGGERLWRRRGIGGRG